MNELKNENMPITDGNYDKSLAVKCTDGTELFTYQQDISRSLELNKMYNMPTIHYPVEPQNK